MLEFCGRKFTCDECPICEGIEHRLGVAREGGYEPQLEYCGCDKVQTEFFIQGYHEAIIPRELWLEVQQILKGENVVPVPSVDEVADLSASDVPRILDGFFVIKPRKDGNNEYLRQL